MNGVEALLQAPLALRAGRVLVEFVWQGALVAALLGVALAILRNASARTRYAAACLALLTMLLLPAASFVASGRRAAPRMSAGPIATLPPAPAASQPLTGSPSPRPPAGSYVPSYLGMVTIGWMAGVCLFSLRLLGGRLLVGRVVRRAVPSAAWEDMARSLAARLGLRRAVRVYETLRVLTPLSLGWLRPVILLPLQALSGLSREEVEAVIAHEIAHIVRRDYLVNLLQSVTETLLFYHPAVWWVSGRVRQEREHCCDVMVVDLLGQREVYARALLSLEEARAARATGLAATGGNLGIRIDRILGRGNSQPALTSVAATALFAIVACAVAAGFSSDAPAASKKQVSTQASGKTSGVVGGVPGGVPGAAVGSVVGGVPGGAVSGVIGGVPGGGIVGSGKSLVVDGVRRIGGVAEGVVRGVPGGNVGGVVGGVVGAIAGGVGTVAAATGNGVAAENRFVVLQVEFADDSQIPAGAEAAIRSQVVGKVYTQAGLKAVAETARTAVQDLGYFKAIVGDPLVTAETSSEQAPGAPTPVRVRLDITPGGRYYVKEITFDGVSVLPEALLRPLFPPAGDILPITVWRKGFEAMKRLYSARRYYNMTLEPEIWFDDEARTITVRIHVDEGTPGGVIGGLPGGVSARSETGTQAPPPAPLNPTSQAPPPPPPPPPAGVEAPKRILLSTPPPAAKKQASEFPPLPQAPRRIVPPPPSSANKQATEPPPAPPRAPAQAPEPPNKEEAQRLQNLQRELDKPFQRWLNEDVAYIITDEERQAFKRLQNAEEREQFIEQFWLRRDPTPDTAENEYKEEHYRRIAHANEHFASGFPGWRTDRGRIYITFGPPDSIEAYPSDGTSFNIAPPPQVLKVLGFERWRYRYIEGIGSDISIGFADLEGNGDYRASTGPISDTLAARLQPRKP